MGDTKTKVGLIGFTERLLEKFLWNFRVIILLGVLGLLIGSLVIFIMGIIETYHLTNMFITHIIHHGTHIDENLYNTIIIQIITTVDDFLLGIVLLIFGLGTYDLFISRINPAEVQDDIRPNWLVFESLDELKSVLGKVVLMILIINFLKIVVNTSFEEPIHLLYLGGGIALAAVALKWSHTEKDIDRTTMQERLKRLMESGSE
ncbi:MAG: YqhA family protein [Deltaproteobacteria bacterium]|nr:YqhA family protein [Candidatus Zymogenaceae bacterium]